jgi:hypothetical protein
MKPGLPKNINHGGTEDTETMFSSVFFVSPW